VASWVFFIARFFPAFSIGLGVIFVQVGFFYRRRYAKLQIPFFGTAVFLFLAALLWFFFRGDLYSDQWVRQYLGINP
jgi:hypothetical protein